METSEKTADNDMQNKRCEVTKKKVNQLSSRYEVITMQQHLVYPTLSSELINYHLIL